MLNAHGRARDLARAAQVAYADTRRGRQSAAAQASMDREAFGASRGAANIGVLTRRDPQRNDGNTGYGLEFWKTWRGDVAAQKVLAVPSMHGSSHSDGGGGGGDDDDDDESRAARRVGQLIADPLAPPVARQRRTRTRLGGGGGGGGGGDGSLRTARDQGEPTRDDENANSDSLRLTSEAEQQRTSTAPTPTSTSGSICDGPTSSNCDDTSSSTTSVAGMQSKPRATTAQKARARQRRAAEIQAHALLSRQLSRYEAQQAWEAHLGERVTVGDLTIKRMIELRHAGPDAAWLRDQGIHLDDEDGDDKNNGSILRRRHGGGISNTKARQQRPQPQRRGGGGGGGGTPAAAAAAAAAASSNAATAKKVAAVPQDVIRKARRYLESQRGFAGQSGRGEAGATKAGQWLNQRVDGVVPPAPGDVRSLRGANFTDAILARNVVAQNRQAARLASRRLQPQFARAEAARKLGPSIRREVGDELEVGWWVRWLPNMAWPGLAWPGLARVHRIVA